MMKCLKNNGWKLAVGVVVLAIGVTGCKRQEAANAEQESTEQESTHTSYLDVQMPEIDVRNQQVYLVDSEGKDVFGPCSYIYSDLDWTNSSGIFRYIDENGFIGYAKWVEGEETKIICSGQFSEGSKMTEGSACVKEGDWFYYIDEEGKRFTNRKYINAYPFGESQGSYARVQKEDGSWSVIDRDEREIFSGFDSINELPLMTVLGTGVKNGNVIVFSVENEYNEPEIIREYEEYSGVDVGNKNFAFVTSKEGKEGVITLWKSETIIPAEYTSIDWLPYEDADNTEEDSYMFVCQKEGGSYDIIYKEF